MGKLASQVRGSKEIITQAAKTNPAALQYATDSLRMGEKFVLSLVKHEPACLSFCSDELRCHEGFNLEAMSKNKEARHYVRPELWEDDAFVLEALAMDVAVLEHVPENVLFDRAVALKAVETRGAAMKYLDAGLCDDPQLALTAVEDDPSSLAYVSERLRADATLVRAALRGSGLALEHALGNLRDDAALVLEATLAGPTMAAQHECPFQFASDRLRKDPDFVMQVVGAAGAVVLMHTPLRRDSHFLLRLSCKVPEAIQYADEALLEDLPFLLTVIRQNPAVMNFVPAELRASASFVLASVRGNGAALDYAPRRFQSEPEFVRAADDAFPSRQPLSHESLEQRGVPLHRLGGPERAKRAGNRIANEWDRLDRLNARGLGDECGILGLPGDACLEWYGPLFLLARLKSICVWRELQLHELRAESKAKGLGKGQRPVGRADSHVHPQGPEPSVILHVGASISAPRHC